MEQQVCGRRGPRTRSPDVSVENTFYFATWSPSYPRAYEQSGNYFGGYQQRDLKILEIGKNNLSRTAERERAGLIQDAHSCPWTLVLLVLRPLNLDQDLTPSTLLVIHHQLSWFFTFRQQTVGLLDLHFQFPK
ncbi:uncharacterized protein LOC115894754 [Rhinopithecus roxellana]|uniref:uncharacterized protein LOC115894754 n=1 Tax=Rhinopithecus roxellana TaxID=61622 RepID=UPI00123731AE|nr:uncharacterized protein LOC115894754 [Rhinopithecus roxellana]